MFIHVAIIVMNISLYTIELYFSLDAITPVVINNSKVVVPMRFLWDGTKEGVKWSHK